MHSVSGRISHLQFGGGPGPRKSFCSRCGWGAIVSTTWFRDSVGPLLVEVSYLDRHAV